MEVLGNLYLRETHGGTGEERKKHSRRKERKEERAVSVGESRKRVIYSGEVPLSYLSG